MLAIATYATKSYLFAWRQFLTRIVAAASHKEEVSFIFATDTSEEAQEAIKLAKTLLPEKWEVTIINLELDDEAPQKKYNEHSQFIISGLQAAAFNYARKIKAKMLWSVEADTLVPPDALKISEWALKMPEANGDPYYDVAACTYYNGLYLGGFGSPNSQINEDFLPHERKLSLRFKNLYNSCEEKINKLQKDIKDYAINKKDENFNNEDFLKIDSLLEKEFKRFHRLRKKMKNFPPDGNIWEIIAKHGWRRRGWLDYAYPGVGKGSIVPSDWCGFGCTLMSEKALLLANFDGYQGKGTQDLFVCWEKWYPAGIKIACIPHIACDHVKYKDKDNKNIDDKNKFIHYIGYHETDGEFKNHLRMKPQPWIPI
jgi:hypothetical protein